MVKRSLALLAALGLSSGCSSLPPESSVACENAARPEIRLSADGRTAFTEIDVLTYNIEGLPWPARTKRGTHLKEIGRRLSELRASGDGPDIIVFQEVFSGAAADAVLSSGYRSIAAGPRRRTERAANTQGRLPGKRNIFKGEIGLNVMSAGLVIATDYPIVAANFVPFAARSCAGFDCLSNKGVLYAELSIPGVPGVVDVFDTHMNSQRASGVSVERHAAAHARQTMELAAFVTQSSPLTDPILISGDFNMRNSDVRHFTFDRVSPLGNVHRYCSENRGVCDVRQSWKYEDQWLRVQDMQLFQSGNVVKVRPIRVEGMFDGGSSGPALSDHDGFRVVYELSWPASETTLQPYCPYSSIATLGG